MDYNMLLTASKVWKSRTIRHMVADGIITKDEGENVVVWESGWVSYTKDGMQFTLPKYTVPLLDFVNSIPTLDFFKVAYLMAQAGMSDPVERLNDMFPNRNPQGGNTYTIAFDELTGYGQVSFLEALLVSDLPLETDIFNVRVSS